MDCSRYHSKYMLREEESTTTKPVDDQDLILTIKICFIVACFIIALIFGILPARVKGCGSNQNFMGLANAFSGGLFLAISLYHILPDVVEEFDEWKQVNGFTSKIPLPYMLCFFGYVMILLIDRVMFDSHAFFGDSHGHAHSEHNENTIQKSSINEIVEENTHENHGIIGVDPAGQRLIQNLQKSMNTNVPTQGVGVVKRSFIEEEKEITSNIKQYLSSNDQFAARMSRAMKTSNEDMKQYFVDGYEGEDRHDDHHHTEKKKCNITPLILMIALSVHSIFEGMALGLMSDLPSVINLTLSILIHKFAESMSITISMSKSKMKFKEILKFVVIFSLATPVGTTLGILLNSTPEIISIIFTSIAGGTFLYVSCSELIIEEFSLPGNRWWKLLAFMMGAVLIGLLLLLE